MKRLIFAAAIMVIMLCGSMALYSEEPTPDPQPALTQVGGYWYAYMDFQGPYPTFNEKVKVMLNEFKAQNLENTADLFAVFYNDPLLDKPENYKWGICYPIKEDAEVKPPLMKKKFEKIDAVVIMHNYDINRIVESNQKARKFIEKSEYKEVWPVYEIFHPAPEGSNIKVIVEVIYPVEKK